MFLLTGRAMRIIDVEDGKTEGQVAGMMVVGSQEGRWHWQGLYMQFQTQLVPLSLFGSVALWPCGYKVLGSVVGHKSWPLLCTLVLTVVLGQCPAGGTTKKGKNAEFGPQCSHDRAKTMQKNQEKWEDLVDSYSSSQGM